MGKRYYCDYCERTFVDDPDSRKKHIQGIGHIRLRNLHYSKFKDLKAIYAEERSKEECKRFMRSGQCQFNENCIHTHYSKEDLAYIAKLIEEEASKKESHIRQASLEGWLIRREQKTDISSTVKHQDRKGIVKKSFAPDGTHLPVSLLTMKDDDICGVEFSEWG